MATQAALHHPLAQVAHALERTVAARDSAALARLLCGEGLPGFSREGDDPGELLWFAIRRFGQPRKPWLDELAILTAALVAELADAVAPRISVEPVAATAGSEIRYNARDTRATAAASDENYVYNLFLFASFQPAHPLLFDRLARFRSEGLELPVLLRQRAVAQLHTALHRQQTDSRFVQAWLDALVELGSRPGRLNRADRAQALALWQAILWAPPDQSVIGELDRQSLLRALKALCGESDVQDPERVGLVQAALGEIDSLYRRPPDFWRRFFASEDDEVALESWVAELVADQWPEEGAPELQLQNENRELWRMLPFGSRAHLRALLSAGDRRDWDAEFETLLWSEPPVALGGALSWRKRLASLKSSLETGHEWQTEIADAAEPTETDEIELNRKDKSRRHEGVYAAFDRVNRTLAGIERELQRRKLGQAQDYFEDLLEHETEYGTPRNLIAKTVSNTATLAAEYGALAWAESLWRQARLLAPHDPVTACGLAETLKALERYAEAEALYRETLAAHPNNAFTACGLAETLKTLERYAEAEALYRETLAAHPNDAFAANGLAETLKALERYEAEALYRETLAAHPNNAFTACGLAETLKTLERYAEAESLYRETLAAHPNDAVAANGLAETLKALERYAEAEALYRETLAAHPNDAFAACGLAETLKTLERYAEAEALYRETLAAHPNNAVAANGLADTLKALERYPEAEALYRATITSHPGNIIARHALANVMRIQRRPADALDLLAEIHTNNLREMRYVAHLRAVIIAESGDVQQALMLLREGLKSCRLSHDRNRFQATIAAVELRAGRHEDAANSARQVASDAPAAARVVQLHAFVAHRDQTEAAEVRAWLDTHAVLSRIQRTVTKIEALYTSQIEPNRAEAERQLVSEELTLLLAA